MEYSNGHTNKSTFWFLFLAVALVIATIVSVQPFEAAGDRSVPGVTYSHGTLQLAIPYRAARNGSGQLTMEVLDPEDRVLGQAERYVAVAEGKGQWQEQIKLEKPLSLDELVWHRVHYRFEYSDRKGAAIEGAESISQILRTPVVHILGQQSYLTGGQAAVRVIVTDSKNEIIAGPGGLHIELLGREQKPRTLFTGRLNHRGTAEAQFRFPAGLVGNFQLRYVVDTTIGSTEFTQPVRLEDKVSILAKSQSTNQVRRFTCARWH